MTGSDVTVGLCSCFARVCSGAGLIAVNDTGAADVVVVVDDEVVEEVEFGGRV